MNSGPRLRGRANPRLSRLTMTMATSSQQAAPILIFLHIPKTAGTTLKVILLEQYGRPGMVFVRASADKFKEIADSTHDGVKVISGHMAFGVHERLQQACTYVTLLRNPVDRVISHYYHVLRGRQHPLHEYVTSRAMSLEDYASSGISREIENGQTRLLAGEDHLGQGLPQTGMPVPRCSGEMLEQAKANLGRHFSAVGLVERFDEALILLKRRFGWTMPFYLRSNVGQNLPNDIRERAGRGALRAIERHNELDLELYRDAKERFAELVAQEPVSFARELATFRLLNGSYGRAYLTSRRLWHRISGRRGRDC
jgi:Galactose-3-O-sulfotransferase